MIPPHRPSTGSLSPSTANTRTCCPFNALTGANAGTREAKPLRCQSETRPSSSRSTMSSISETSYFRPVSRARLVARASISGGNSAWLTFTPTPAITTSPVRSQSMPAILRPCASTSLGHLTVNRGSWFVVRGSWFVVRGSWMATGQAAQVRGVLPTLRRAAAWRLRLARGRRRPTPLKTSGSHQARSATHGRGVHAPLSVHSP